jgi:hypothetical protein
VKTGPQVVGLFLILGVAACGKKGPPLPPLVRLPTPPTEFSVQRRGSSVAIQFGVPGGNTDGSTPADISRVEVYALTAPEAVTAAEIFQRGAPIGRVLVNPPPDPDTPEGQPAKPSGPLPPDGIDQGAIARLGETLNPDESGDPTKVRWYIAVGFNKRGRRGSTSPPMAVPVGWPPDPPGKPEVTWDETTITVTWDAPESADPDVALGYHVYAAGDVPIRLTSQPLEEMTFDDKRIEWGAERCYVVRSVEVVEKLPLESEASPSTCVTLADTFAPMAPEGLTVVASEGAMNLIWNPNQEADLAGYLLWRAMPSDGPLVSITPSPVKESTFRDTVPGGAHVAYAVQAVDKAGNVSPMSMRVEETAR